MQQDPKRKQCTEMGVLLERDVDSLHGIINTFFPLLLSLLLLQPLGKPSSQIPGVLKYQIYLKGWSPRKLATQTPFLMAAARAFSGL